MSDIALTLTVGDGNLVAGDLYLNPNGTVQLTQNLSQEVGQELYIRLRSIKGEWFLDPTVGLPYFQVILGQKIPIGIVSQVFRQVIITCPGVQTLLTFDLAVNAQRQMSLTFSCRLQNGTTLTSADFGPFIVGGV